MNKRHNPIKDAVIRYQTDDKAYNKQNRNWIKGLMAGTPQEDLIEFLNELDYYQLKIAVGCGIPGHAQPLSIIKLRQLREEVDQYVRSMEDESQELFSVQDGEVLENNKPDPDKENIEKNNKTPK